MTSKKVLIGGALVTAFAGFASYAPAFLDPDKTARNAQTTRKVATSDGHGHVHGSGHPEGEHAEEGVVKLSGDQIAAANIVLSKVDKGTLTSRISVPGTIIMDPDHIARITVKLSGTVAELKKRIGDTVRKDEVLAVLESREVADAKSEYLAARLDNELQQELFERDKTLWEKRVATELQFLKSRNSAAQTRMKLDLARQKLFALGLNVKDISAIPHQPEALLSRQEVRSPIAGRIVERKVELGSIVGRDDLETTLFVIADLSTVAVELAVATDDLDGIKENQRVIFKSTNTNSTSVIKQKEGKIIFVNPMIDKETRSARVLAIMENKDFAWRPGTFVTADIIVEEQAADVSVPASAIQRIGNETVVFVRTEEGFEKREVVVGKNDGQTAEILFGLDSGESVASTNTFTLKADLGKSEAEHSH